MTWSGLATNVFGSLLLLLLKGEDDVMEPPVPTDNELEFVVLFRRANAVVGVDEDEEVMLTERASVVAGRMDGNMGMV